MTDTRNLPATIPNVSALAREHGVSRQTIRRRLPAGWTPSVPVSGEVLPPVPPRGHAVARGGQGVATVLIIVAIAIAALALAINGQTGWRFGTTPFASWTVAGLSLCCDLLAIVLPCASAPPCH